MLEDNIAPHNGFGNGTPGVYHSLCFLDDEVPPELAAALAKGGYTRVHLEEPPTSVNFVASAALATARPDEGFGAESLHKDLRVVAVLDSKDQRTHKCRSLYAASAGIPKEVEYLGHKITTNFGSTDYKLQGMTLEKLIMSVAPRPFPPPVDMEGFYVFVSRLTMMAGLRLLSKPKGRKDKQGRCIHGFYNLLDLQHPPELRVWYEGVDETGDWDVDRARAVAGSVGEALKKTRVRVSMVAEVTAPAALQTLDEGLCARAAARRDIASTAIAAAERERREEQRRAREEGTTMAAGVYSRSQISDPYWTRSLHKS